MDMFAWVQDLPGGWQATLSLVLAFLATIFLVLGIFSVVAGGRSPLERRLEYVAHQREAVAKNKNTTEEGGFEVRWLEPAVKLALPSDAAKRSETRARLVRAGIRHANAVSYYYGLKVVLAFALPALALIPVLIMVGIFYLLLIAPMRKRQKQHDEMLRNLKHGDKVVTNGGVFGTVVGIEEDRVRLKIADQVKIEVQKQGIASLAGDGD